MIPLFSLKNDVRFSYMFVEQVLKKSENKEVFYKYLKYWRRFLYASNRK
jgi:hypothetical protein